EKLKILISSDNHLGYMERDNIRGQDSINSFEEILNISNKKNVDMILLGGDLFHDNLPTRSSLHACMSLIRQYTFGSGEKSSRSKLNIESDMTLNFMDRFGTANFLSGDFRVRLPIFSIHGNHDDPSGVERLCSLDLLSTAGLVNYFGKFDRVDAIDVHPILLTKGSVKVALYGIGNVRDERLYRTFRNNNVNFYPPEDRDEWYNILVVHQNRIAHSDTNFLPEAFLPKWMDLVIWGHEHQCIPNVEYNSERSFQVLQPGSSVATALSIGEADRKHAFILEVDSEKNGELKKIPLKTVRQFEIDEISLSEFTELNSYTWEEISVVIIDYIKKMVKKAEENFMALNKTATVVPLPLIRLKVTYQEQISQLSPIRFYPLLEPLVANPKSCLKFYKQTPRKAKGEKSQSSGSQFNLSTQINLDNLQLEDVLAEFNNATQFQLLPQTTLDRAVHKLIDKEDKYGVEKVIQGTVKELQKGLTDEQVLYKLDS
ncbi:Metallo-dependent phosphatase, partial [Conidiobolus coronatus NRRL 28638]